MQVNEITNEMQTSGRKTNAKSIRQVESKMKQKMVEFGSRCLIVLTVILIRVILIRVIRVRVRCKALTPKCKLKKKTQALM